MALLAIDRTMRNSWQGSKGVRYRYFYETRSETLKDKPIEDVEVPVTLLWFPDSFGPREASSQRGAKVVCRCQ